MPNISSKEWRENKQNQLAKVEHGITKHNKQTILKKRLSVMVTNNLFSEPILLIYSFTTCILTIFH